MTATLILGLVAIGAIGLLGLAIGSLEAIALPVTAAVLGITAAIAGVTWAIMNWSTVVTFLTHPLDALTGKFGVVGQVIQALLIPLEVLAAPFIAVGWAAAHMGDIMGALAAVAAGFREAWGNVSTFVGSSIQPFQILASTIGGVLGPVLQAVGGWIDTTFLQPIRNMVTVVQLAVGWFLKWSDALNVVKDAMGWLGDQTHRFLQFLGILHDGPAKVADTVHSTPGSNTIVGSNLTPKPGVVAPSLTIGGTVGLPSALPGIHLPPKGQWPAAPGYLPPHLIGPPAPIRKNGGLAIVGQPLDTPFSPSSTSVVPHYTINVHPGAAAIHLHALPHEGADQAVKRAVDQAGHEIAEAIRTGMGRTGAGGPATTRIPTLRQTYRSQKRKDGRP